MRALGLVLALLVVSSVLSGCGGGAGTGATDSGMVTAVTGTSSTGSSGSTGAGTRAPAQSNPGQASLTLKDGSAALSHVASREWTLEKTGALDGTNVNWTVTATRGSLGAGKLGVHGYVRVLNSGSADATIGNIVVNLQRKVSGNKFYTAASDIADATSGDAATTARVVAGASSENRTSFTESAASGTLEFMDARNNTTFSLTPQLRIPAGQAIDLLYSASYDSSVLGIPTGESVRAEVIVTFGNAGARGGSGASATNVDINGNGVLDADEAYVRSVPDRQTRTVPALAECDATPTLTDAATAVTTTGTVTFANFTTTIGAGNGTQVLDATLGASATVVAEPGTGGGTITNTANLRSDPTYLTVDGPLDPLTFLPTFTYRFLISAGFDVNACNTQVIAAPKVPPPTGFVTGDFQTRTQGGWGAKPNGNNAGTMLAQGFTSVYPAGIEVGIPGSTGFSMKFTSARAVCDFLPGGGTAAPLTSDLINATKSSSGVFGGQVLALQINVDMSKAAMPAFPSGLANLVLVGTGTSLDGRTVAEVLAAANLTLGGGPLPEGFSLSSLNDLVTRLNEAFDNGTPSGFAQSHLVRR